MNKTQSSSSANETIISSVPRPVEEKPKVFTEVAADPANGVAAYWNVDAEGFNEILVTRFQDRKGADVALIGETTETQKTFGQVGFVTIYLPVGVWKYDTSDDGTNYRRVTTLTSIKDAPKQAVNISLDGVSSAKVWSRYLKVA